MPEANWVRHGVHLGIVGVRETVRSLRQNPYRLRLLGIAAIGLGISFGGMGVLYALLLRSLEGPITIPSGVHLGVSSLWAFAVWFFSQRGLTYWRRPNAQAFVLTTVSTRTFAVGMLLTEFLTACLFLVPPTILLIGVVGYAFLSPVSLLLVPLSVSLFVASAIVVGYTVGFAYLHVIARSRGLPNYQGQLMAQLAFLAVIVYLIAQSLGGIPAVWEMTTFEWLPISWLVDSAVLGTPVTAPLNRALAGVLGSLVVIGGGSLVVMRLAGAYWVTDRGSTTSGDDGTTSSSRSHAGKTLSNSISPLVVPGFIDQPTQQVAQVVLLRLRRTPRQRLFLFSLVISLGIYLSLLYTQLDEGLSLVPVVCTLFFPWFVGAAFGLNPLGDEGAVLPATLTSSVSSQQYVRGLMLPGILYGLPLTVLGTLVGSMVSPYPLRVRVGFVVGGVILNVVAVALAPAVGMRFPRFSSITISQSDGIMPPSITAISVYSLTIGVLGGGVFLVLLAPASVYELITNGVISIEWVRLSSVVGGLSIALVVARWGYTAAIQQFERYTLS